MIQTVIAYTNQDEITNKLRAVFEKLDSDRSGALSYAELRDGLKKYTPPIKLTEEEWKAITYNNRLCTEEQEIDLERWDVIMRAQMVMYCHRQLAVSIPAVLKDDKHLGILMFAVKLILDRTPELKKDELVPEVAGQKGSSEPLTPNSPSSPLARAASVRSPMMRSGSIAMLENGVQSPVSGGKAKLLGKARKSFRESKKNRRRNSQSPESRAPQSPDLDAEDDEQFGDEAGAGSGARRMPRQVSYDDMAEEIRGQDEDAPLSLPISETLSEDDGLTLIPPPMRGNGKVTQGKSAQTLKDTSRATSCRSATSEALSMDSVASDLGEVGGGVGGGDNSLESHESSVASLRVWKRQPAPVQHIQQRAMVAVYNPTPPVTPLTPAPGSKRMVNQSAGKQGGSGCCVRIIAAFKAVEDNLREAISSVEARVEALEVDDVSKAVVEQYQKTLREYNDRIHKLERHNQELHQHNHELHRVWAAAAVSAAANEGSTSLEHQNERQNHRQERDELPQRRRQQQEQQQPKSPLQPTHPQHQVHFNGHESAGSINEKARAFPQEKSQHNGSNGFRPDQELQFVQQAPSHIKLHHANVSPWTAETQPPATDSVMTTGHNEVLSSPHPPTLTPHPQLQGVVLTPQTQSGTSQVSTLLPHVGKSPATPFYSFDEPEGNPVFLKYLSEQEEQLRERDQRVVETKKKKIHRESRSSALARAAPQPAEPTSSMLPAIKPEIASTPRHRSRRASSQSLPRSPSQGNLSFTADVIAVPPPPSVSRHLTSPSSVSEHEEPAQDAQELSSAGARGGCGGNDGGPSRGEGNSPRVVFASPERTGLSHGRSGASPSSVSTARFHHHVPASVSPSAEFAQPRAKPASGVESQSPRRTWSSDAGKVSTPDSADRAKVVADRLQALQDLLSQGVCGGSCACLR